MFIRRVRVLFLSLFLSLFVVSYVQASELYRYLGSKDSPVVIEEFSSFTCPYCAIFHKNIYAKLKEDYIDKGKVRLVYRSYPLDNVAMATNLLALTIPKEKFFQFIEYVYFYQNELISKPYVTLLNWASKFGYTKKQFKDIIQNDKLLDLISSDMKKIDEKYKIMGTPLILLNGNKYEGKISSKKEFFKLLDSILEGK